MPEPTSQAIPARARKDVVEAKPSNKRTIKAVAEMELKLVDLFAKAFDELNYMRRQQLINKYKAMASHLIKKLWELVFLQYT